MENLASKIEAAEENVRLAASKGYDAYTAARSVLQDLEEQALLAELGDRADETVIVLGKTYQNKAELKSLGFRWDAGARGWVGTRKHIHGNVPAGCYLATYSEAALASMDHQDSII